MKFISSSDFSFLLLILSYNRVDGLRKPDISIGFNVGHETNSENIGEFSATPRIKWETDEISIGDMVSVQGGIDLTVIDVERPRASLWGMAATKTSRLPQISIRGDYDAKDENDAVDLDLRLKDVLTRNNMNLRVLGSYNLKSQTVKADLVSTSVSIDPPVIGGKFKIDPQYDLNSMRPDATVGYSFRDTSFQVDGRSKKLTISQFFGNKKNKIVPSLKLGAREDSNSEDGSGNSSFLKDFSLSYSRSLSEGGKITATWKPDDSLSVQWNDGGWNANIRAPIDGYYKINGGVKLSVKQNIDVSL